MTGSTGRNNHRHPEPLGEDLVTIVTVTALPDGGRTVDCAKHGNIRIIGASLHAAEQASRTRRLHVQQAHPTAVRQTAVVTRGVRTRLAQHAALARIRMWLVRPGTTTAKTVLGEVFDLLEDDEPEESPCPPPKV